MDPNPPDLAELPRTRRTSRRRRSSPNAISLGDFEAEFAAPPPATRTPPTLKGVSLVAALVLLSILLVFMVGCGTTTIAQTEIVTGVDYKVTNVHRTAEKLPERLRRVALLPLSTEPGRSDIASGRAALEPILQSELDRLNTFEVIRVTPEQLRHLTGRSEWSASEKLPLDFLSSLKNEIGVDGILFCRLTRYHPYPPMAIGWNLKLVDATDGQVWWAADEMFDLSDPTVVTAARRWELKHQKYYQSTPLLADSRTALISPRRLGRYSAAALFATLPER